MVLSRRERYIVIGTLGFLAAAVLYWVALSPLLDRLAAVRKDKEKYAGLLQEANDLRAQQPGLKKYWREKVRDTLKSDPSSADSQLRHELNQWAKSDDVGLKPPTMTPVRSLDKSRLPQIGLDVTAAGTWRSIFNMIWKIEKAPIPIKLAELQVSARRDGIDDLTAVFKVSTLCSPKSGAPLASQPDKSTAPAPAPSSVPTSTPEPRPPATSAPADATGPASAAGETGSTGSTGPTSQPTTQGGM